MEHQQRQDPLFPSEPGSDLVVRRSGPPTPWNAGDVIAIIVESCQAGGVPLHRRVKGMLAKQAKELLEDGFDYLDVVEAASLALVRGHPHLMWRIAQDVVVARREGGLMSYDQYRGSFEKSELQRAYEIAERTLRPQIEKGDRG